MAAPSSQTMEFGDALWIKDAFTRFQHILHAELALLDLYLVSPKGNLHVGNLIAFGELCFPTDLPNKVPECIEDIRQATRCIAFELPTAAGFHLHRANESVLHRYYDAASGGRGRPSGRNIGDYLKEMRDNKIGKDVVVAALKDLKDLHRNPLIHPEHSLESVDEALALMGSIHAVMVHMLKELPELPPPAPPIPTQPIPGA